MDKLLHNKQTVAAKYFVHKDSQNFCGLWDMVFLPSHIEDIELQIEKPKFWKL